MQQLEQFLLLQLYMSFDLLSELSLSVFSKNLNPDKTEIRINKIKYLFVIYLYYKIAI